MGLGEGPLLEVIAGTLFALLVLYGCAAPMVPLARRLFGDRDVLLRALAVIVLGACLLTATFHLLLAFSAFNRIAAGATLAAGIAAARWFGFRHGDFIHSLARDARGLARLARRLRARPAQLVYGLAGLFAMVTVARAMMLPTVAWDSITYHYVKAAMWVQSGGPIALEAPGGWSMYRSIFAGGEIFTAWAMLPFGNDLAVGAVDLAWWGCNGLALYALARELGLRVRHRAAVVTYALFLPAAWDAVGWGYVDLPNTALLLSGLVFAIRALRTGAAPAILLSVLALGLAAGIKLTSLPVLAVTAAILFASVVRSEQNPHAGLAMLALGGLACALIVGPWLVANLLETGYPLRFPISVAGVQLGADNPAFAWSQARDIEPYILAAEWKALAGLFPLPTVHASHLSALSLVPLALVPAGFIRLLRARPDLRSSLFLIACLSAAILLAFYDRAFSFSRLEFTWVNGRFLMPIVFVGLPISFCALPSAGRWRDALSSYLLVALLIHFACFGPSRLTLPSPDIVARGFVAVALGAGVLALLLRRPLPALATGAVLGLLAFAPAIGLQQLRHIDRRYPLLANRDVSADVFRYWWQSAHLAEREGRALRIAVTAGPRQDADNWLMYYFMGRNLQNTLHYLPISTDGEIIAFGPDTRRRDEADVDAWLARLQEQRISHVFSFFPSSLEIGWMDERPSRFLRLNGDDQHWGFFRVLEAPARASGLDRVGGA